MSAATDDRAATPVDPTRPRFAYARDGTSPPAVAIVTPFHDAGPEFDETVASVLAQSLQSFEWILVDDASSDVQAIARLGALAARDARVRVLRHDRNRGRSAARNTGFRAASSDFVYVLDQDDLLEPTALEKCLWALLSHGEWGFANGWSIGFGAQHYRWERGFENGAGFLDENGVAGRALIRRAVFDEVDGYDENLREGFEDWDFWLRCAARGIWGGTLPEVLDWFRRKDPPADWESPERVAAMGRELRRRHATLSAARFPTPRPAPEPSSAPIPEEIPFANPLRKQRPRLLFIVPWLTLGGADRWNLDLTTQLAARGWEVTLATTLEGDHGWEPAFTRVTPDVFVLPRLAHLADRTRLLRYLIESRRPDVVLVSNSEFAYRLLPVLRAHCPDPVYVDFCHMEQEEWKSGGYPRFSLLMRGALDRTGVSSQHLKEWMVSRGAERSTIAVVTTNIDVSHWRRDPHARARLRQAWNVGADEPVIVFAARLCEQKRPLALLHTLAALAHRGVAYRAIVAGDGELRPQIEAFVKKNDLGGRIELLGAVAPDAMCDVLSAADVAFLPSRWEGIALALFEAMAMELAVVAADVGGQRELVTPECGVLVPAGTEERDVAGWVAALAPLLQDPARRRELGRRARERVASQFQIEQMTDGMIGLFEAARVARDGSEPARLPGPLVSAWTAHAIECLRLSSADPALDTEPHAGSVAAQRDAQGWRSTEARLRRIEASRSWQLVRAAKRSLPYRIFARLRYGADWEWDAP